MTTMAAIDRVAHHSVILDMMSMASYRAKQAHDQLANSNGVTSARGVVDKAQASQ